MLRKVRVPLMKDIFYEEVTERIGKHVLASKIRSVTTEDFENVIELHKNGKCPHTIVKDTPGWMYDFRSCFICGKGLGTV